MMQRPNEKKPQTIVHKDHSVIIPPTTLRDRAMSIGGGSKDGFDTEALARAEEALAALASAFSQWMSDEAVELVDGHIDASRAVVRDDARDEGDKVARDLMAELRSAREAIIGVTRCVKITAEIY